MGNSESSFASLTDTGATNLRGDGVQKTYEDVPDHLLVSIIDHTNLNPDATSSDIKTLCEEARTYKFLSVCVNPIWVPLACAELSNSNVKVTTVIGFPFGATYTEVKELETRIALEAGAEEIDMVINQGSLLSGDIELLKQDIRRVVQATDGKVITKVILETANLSPEHIKTGCETALKAGAHFVKTCTGLYGTAKIADIEVMRDTVGSRMGIKASGGIHDRATAIAMVNAGANRIGTSSSIELLKKKK